MFATIAITNYGIEMERKLMQALAERREVFALLLFTVRIKNIGFPDFPVDIKVF